MSDSGKGGALERLAIIADRFLLPTAIRMHGEAEADNAWRMAHTQEAIEDLKQQGRIRRELEDARRNDNIKSIAHQAAAQVPHLEKKLLCAPAEIESGSQDPELHPEPDWFFKFKSFAQDTSDRDIQALWSKVLAGEVVQPGRFSVRLLQTISLMRKSDALAFEKFANYVWFGRAPLMFQFTNTEVDAFLIKTQGMTEEFYENLHSWGLIDNTGLHILDLKSHQQMRLRHGPNEYIMERGGISLRESLMVDHHLRLRALTPLGRELYLLCDPVVDQLYVKALIDSVLRFQIKFVCQAAIREPTGSTRPSIADGDGGLSTWLP